MHTRSVVSTLLAALPLAACAGGAGPGAMAGPAALAYAVPPTATVTYLQADTIQMEMDMGGQVLDVDIGAVATIDLSYGGAGDAIEVSATYRDFEITASNPMAGTQRGDESEIDGPVVFTIDRTGAGTLVTAPNVKGVSAQAISPAAMAITFFPRLPGRAVTPGEMWVDTVTYNTVEASGTNEGTSVYEFTAVGDTLVGGQTLLKVSFVSTDERISETSQEGADITQDVVGEGAGYYLWDGARNLIVEQFAEGRLRGTMTVSIAPMPLGLDMVVVQRMKLVPGN